MILCVGELLADLTADGEESGEVTYKCRPGGAPFNAACTLRRLGAECGFVGCVGDDPVGQWLRRFAAGQGFTPLLLRTDGERNTSMAFVTLDLNGERSFGFCRKRAADAYLPEIDDDTLKRVNWLHIGSLCLSSGYGRKYIDELTGRARSMNITVSFDVNHREGVFPSVSAASAAYLDAAEKADVIKLSENEIPLLGEDFIGSHPDKAVFITLGEKGSRWFYKTMSGQAETLKVTPVDTTGAGDAFLAGAVYVLAGAARPYTRSALNGAARSGNVCGALCACQRGALGYLLTKAALNEGLAALEPKR